MNRAFQRFGLLLCVVLAGGAMPAAMPLAGAATQVSLTKDINVAAPPSSSFAGASTGDGWDVSFYGDRVFNVFHHGYQFVVDCHLQIDGSHCDTVSGVSPWPKTATSDAPPSDFTSPAHASGWIDENTGRMYGWSSRASDGTGGIVCVDLTTPAANPFCGFTALTAAGVHPENATTTFGARAAVGNNLFAYDPNAERMLCFSTATDAACAGQPYAIALGGIVPYTTGGIDNGTLAAGGKVFVHAEDDNATGGVITCFDPATKTTCSGTWPQTVGDHLTGGNYSLGSIGAPFPYLSTTGATLGVCLPYGGVVPCWSVSGATIATPVALASTIASSDTWTEGTTLGTRVFLPSGADPSGSGDAVYCYDFAIGASCANFPIQTDASTYLYTVTSDPVRVGCMWINADHGDGTHSQIRTFDAYDGTSGCADRVHVTSSVVIPDAGCTALGWSGLQLLDPPVSDYASATVTLTGADGTPVAGGTDLVLDGTGRVDLSALTIPAAVVFTLNFVTPTFSGSGVIIRFTWDSVGTSNCESNATRVPNPPTISSATADSTDGALIVAFTAPVDPGTSSITSYRYSTDNGVTWRVRTDGGGASNLMSITRVSSDGTSIVDGTAYDIVLRAVSDVGTGLASNPVPVTAVVPELLHAPVTAAFPAATSTAVTPVYLAGFTVDVTVDLTTTFGSISVDPNPGLTTSCSPCSGSAVSFTGPQNAVNVVLSTLVATAGIAGTGTITVAATKSGDSTPSQTANINFIVDLSRLTTPAQPTPTPVSMSTITVAFSAVAHASSYTVRVYRSDGVTTVGLPHTNFVSGSPIAGLDAGTTYKFSITAIGDGLTYSDSLVGSKGTAATLPVPTVPIPCSIPRPSQTLVTASGKVYAVDGAGHLITVPSFDSARTQLTQPLIGATATATAHGSWSLADDGGVFTAGDAPFAGSLSHTRLKAPVTGIAGTPCAKGYDILATDGGVFAFGDARFYGSTGAIKLNRPMAGIAVTRAGRGYYTVANDGGVFAFGDARFHGSMAHLTLASPIFDLVQNAGNAGYWLVASDGGVFAFGTVGFYGSLGGHKTTSPIVGLLPTPSFHGYWLLSANGTTYPFGDAAR